ncbi:MAG TPA: hypothetical protein VD866_09130 [Urbifossiella sp.]|nr:hypothetical protein [Urbifossiella sp.]
MRLTCAITAALILAAGSAPAADGVADLLGWVPDQANAALFIDAEALHKTDMAVRLKWAGQKGPTSGLESLPPNATRLVVGCQIDLNGGIGWEVSVAAQKKHVGEAEFAKANGGTRDTVGGKSVVVTERYGIATTLAPGVVGAHQPSNRQDAGRWLRSATGKVGPGMSPYLKQAAALVGPQTPVVLAFDTADMLPAAKLKAGLAKAKSLEGKKVTPDALADLFSGLKGVTVLFRITDHMAGEIRLDFDGPAAALKDVAKPLLVEVLDQMGLGDDDFDAWVAAVEGNRVTYRGGLTRETAGLLVAPFLRPSLGSLGGGDDSSEPATKAEVSVRYYKAVSKKLGEMKKATHKSFQAMALSYNQSARHIDDLPILNVDEDLLGWGASLTSTLRTMAITAQAANGQMSALDAQRSMSQIRDPNYYYGSGAGMRAGYWGAAGYAYNYAVPTGTTTTYTVSNNASINQLVAQTKEQEHQYRLNTWKTIDQVTQDVRRAMVKKYQVEF